ncbi:MAG TPA: hypothetical protein VJA16_14870 [Thermoanaerobaculia bacterium]
MAFEFDKRQAQAPVRVAWRLGAKTMAGLEEMAREEGVRVEQLAQQALDYVLAERRRKKQP